MRNAALLIVAILLAAGVALFVQGRGGEEVQQIKPVEEISILVAKDDIPPGTFIRGETHLDWSARPKESIMPGVIIQGSVSMGNYEGAITRARIAKGEPITSQNTVKPDDGGFLSAVLKPGMRAVTVAVTAASGNAGFVFPGDKVDVILTRTLTEEGSSLSSNYTETVLRNLRVMAMDQRFNNPDNEITVAKTATIEVSPSQAEVLIKASKVGELSLSLISASRIDDVEDAEVVEDEETRKIDEELSKALEDDQEDDLEGEQKDDQKDETGDKSVKKTVAEGSGKNNVTKTIKYSPEKADAKLTDSQNDQEIMAIGHRVSIIKGGDQTEVIKKDFMPNGH
jgi:pilus assembly protein CpaB